MAFEIPKVKYSGAIKRVVLGSNGKGITAGGENCYPFHLFEGEMPNRPVLAMEVWDMPPDEWPEVCKEPFADVLNDPGAWAKKCVEKYGAEAIVVQLKSTDPNGLNAPAEKASETVGKVLNAVKVPVIVWGTANSAKDTEVLRKIAEDYEGKNLFLGPVEEDNHKAVGAAALGYKHSVVASSPIDVNLAKQLNILLNNLGVPMERILIDPTTGGLGYGLEYTYSVMERIRMAALVQEDDKLVLPMINNVGNEVWKTKEAKLTKGEAPDLGDDRMRGVLMETVSAICFLLAGSNVLILRHPRSVELVKGFVDRITAKRAPSAKRVQVNRERAKPLAAEAKPAPKAEPKPSPAAAAPKEAPAPKPEIKPAEKPKPVEVPRPELRVVPPPDLEAEARAKAEAERKAKEEAEAKAKAEAEAKARAEAEAKAKAEAEEKAKREAERKAKEEAKAKEAEELAELRKKRKEEREKHIAAASQKGKEKAEVTYGKGPEPGSAGPEGIYLIRSLERWRLRGDGILKK